MKLYRKISLIMIAIVAGVMLNFISLFFHKEGKVADSQCGGTKAEVCRSYGGYEGTRGFPLGYNKIVSFANEHKANDVGFTEVPELMLNIGFWTSISAGGLYLLAIRNRKK